MPNKEHLLKLEEGVSNWNEWRESNPGIDIDLTGADLRGRNLDGINFSGADLFQSVLSEASLVAADLEKAHLRDALLESANLSSSHLDNAVLTGAVFNEACLEKAWLVGANLTWTQFQGAHLNYANLSETKMTWSNFRNAQMNHANFERADILESNFESAHLREANFERATLTVTNFKHADLSGSKVFGVAAWNLDLHGANESNLVITDVTYYDDAIITVDSLELSQFVYLLLHNEKIRNAIDTIGKKGVLILGRFTEDRKRVLDLLREGLRQLNFVPMIFDFEKPTQRDFTETVKILAGISRFIIADITNPKSSPLELQATMPDYMVPFVPIIHEDEEPFSMFRDLKGKYGDWVLDVLAYDSAESLLKVLETAIVSPAIEKSDQLLLRRAQAVNKRHVADYM